jgi:glycine cleavage system transcriptional repressor
VNIGHPLDKQVLHGTFDRQIKASKQRPGALGRGYFLCLPTRYNYYLSSYPTGKLILPQTPQHFLVITALGVDRPGIVNAITRHVSSCGCNIEDSRLAMLGDEFTFIMLLSGSWNAITLIESTLPLKGAEMELLIVMKRTNAAIRPPMPETVWVQVEVNDSPHIIERFTDLFDSHQMHIAELVSRTQPAQENRPPLLYIQITAHSPAHRDATLIEQAFHALCTELDAQGTISVVNYPQHDEKMESSNESTESR